MNCSEDSQANCLQLLMLMMKRLPHTRAEFHEIGGVELVQQVLRTPLAAVGYKIADVRVMHSTHSVVFLLFSTYSGHLYMITLGS